MPRDTSGLFSLPVGNPVAPGTLIESNWANTTLDDIAYAMTDSLSRSGHGAMLAPLTLFNSLPTNALHATSKLYVDNRVNGITSIPGNAGTATKLAPGATINTVLFDGSAPITITAIDPAYTAADVLAKIKTVDGTGSGLDADLLDGQSGAYYLDLANATGILTVPKGGTGVATLTGMVKGNGAAAFTAAVAGTDYVAPGGSITGNAATASKLSPGRNINGVLFDGTVDITVADATKLPVGGTAVAASKLTPGRTINGVFFDGTTNITLPASSDSATLGGQPPSYYLDNANATGIMTVPKGGTGVGTLTGLAKGNGTNAFTAAVAGTDYVAPSALAGYLPLAGGTLTGDLGIVKSAAAQFVVKSTTAYAGIVIDTVAGQGNYIAGNKNGVGRWAMYIGNGDAESGSNAGSNFNMIRLSDTGAYLGESLTIARNTGNIICAGSITASPPAANDAELNLNAPASGKNAIVWFRTNNQSRWGITKSTGAESGGDAGSDLLFLRFNDAGGYVDSPFQISRLDGSISLIGNLARFIFKSSSWSWNGTFDSVYWLNSVMARGSMNLQTLDLPGSWRGWRLDSNGQTFDLQSNGSGYAPVSWLTYSDLRLKRALEPIKDAMSKISALTGYTFERTDAKENDGSARKQIGLVAQEVLPVLPQAVSQTNDYEMKPVLALDYNAITALLVNAVKELHAEIQALKANIPAH